MKIATWNVNSLRVRLPQVLGWLADQRPDVMCLQETKLVDDDFPKDEIKAAGYHAAFAGQRTYNGVATLSRLLPEEVVIDVKGLGDKQKRLVAATCGDVRILNVYVPNGQEIGSDKYDFKLEWLRRLTDYIATELKSHARLALLGDFNIAPEEQDVHDPARWETSVLFSREVRQAFRELLALGLADVFRAFDQPANSFTWWDYRAGAFRRDRGLRIDHILCSQPLSAACRACEIDRAPRGWARPSDHTPVVATFAIG
jgi:exodeoxyribonuclease III